MFTKSKLSRFITLSTLGAILITPVQAIHTPTSAFNLNDTKQQSQLKGLRTTTLSIVEIPDLIVRGGRGGGGGSRGGGGVHNFGGRSGASFGSVRGNSLSRPSSRGMGTLNRPSTGRERNIPRQQFDRPPTHQLPHPQNISQPIRQQPMSGKINNLPSTRETQNRTNRQPSYPRDRDNTRWSGNKQTPLRGDLDKERNVNRDLNRNVNIDSNGWNWEDDGWPVGAGAAGFALGAIVGSLPSTYETVYIQGEPYYYSQGAYYAPSGNEGYTIVAPPTGAIVSTLPPDATEVQVGGQLLYQAGNVYYQSINYNGQQMFQVVQY